MTDQVRWGDYVFTVLSKAQADAETAPGIYVFAAPNGAGQWIAKYVGQTESFAGRLPNHPKWSVALLMGAKAVHCLHVPTQADRDLIEAWMIQAYQPPLNIHGKQQRVCV